MRQFRSVSSIKIHDPSRPSLALQEESNLQKMEKASNVQEIEFTSVSKVIGEPVTVIYGVPDLTPGFITTILDTTTSPSSDDDPCFGEWLEGRKIQKLFGDKYHYGKVEEYDKETNLYIVVYEDGDYENMQWHELEEVLLPLDISIPLTTLALARCKSEKSVSALSKGRNGFSNCSGRKKNLSGNTRHGTLQLQNGLQREYTTAPNTCNGQESYSTPVFDDLEQADCQNFGEWIEGRKVQKLFGDRYYLGKVEKYDKETKWYKVVYEDGDFEDLEWHELERLLVPLDISVPSFSGEALNILRSNQNGESVGESVLTGAHSLNQSRKTARAEKQRREKSIVHHSACHPK